MPLMMTYDTLEAIPEPIRDAYSPTEDGKFKLAGFVPEKDVLGLKEKTSELLGARKKLVDEYGGLTPQQVRDLARAEADRQTAEAEKKGEWEKVKERLRTEADERVAVEKGRADKWEGFVDRKLKRAEAESAIRDAGAKDEKAVKVLLPHLLAELERAEEGDEVAFYVRAEDGKGFRIGAGGARMTPKEFAATKLKAEYPELFAASGATGGGAPGATTAAGVALDDMPPEQRLARGLSGKR